VSKKAKLSNWEKIAGFVFGVFFCIVLLVLTVIIRDPTPAQYATFKTILAIAAAGIAGILTGFIQVEGTFQKFALRAGGALAVFVIVFFFTVSPPKAIPHPEQEITDVNQTVGEGGTGIIHTGEGDINVER
jgi:hypothetical protein